MQSVQQRYTYGEKSNHVIPAKQSVRKRPGAVIPAKQSVRKRPGAVIPAKQSVRKRPGAVIPAKAGIQRYLFIQHLKYSQNGMYCVFSHYRTDWKAGIQTCIVSTKYFNQILKIFSPGGVETIPPP